MNRHFEDARYYVKRAVKTAKRGVRKEFEPVERRVRQRMGWEKESEGRLEEIKADLKVIQDKAEGEAKDAIYEAREKIETYREKQSA